MGSDTVTISLTRGELTQMQYDLFEARRIYQNKIETIARAVEVNEEQLINYRLLFSGNTELDKKLSDIYAKMV